MFEIMIEKAPSYLISLLPNVNNLSDQETAKYQPFTAKQIVSNILFLLSTLNGWFNLGDSIRKSHINSIFKSKLLSFIRPVQSKNYNIFDLTGSSLLIRLVLDFSHLNDHKFHHNFQDCMNPLCS